LQRAEDSSVVSGGDGESGDSADQEWQAEVVHRGDYIAEFNSGTGYETPNSIESFPSSLLITSCHSNPKPPALGLLSPVQYAPSHERQREKGYKMQVPAKPLQ
jgi:hypothetical protein